jgi:type IV pilus assembly protein PilV
MMAPPLQSSPRAQRGFGLIEVLVALTILSIGMLGLAAMQLNSLQNARESLNTTIATIMVRDMNERAWAQQDETCQGIKSSWKDYVDNFEGLPSAYGEGENIGNGLYDLEITWQGRGDPDDADYEPPHVNLVAFLPCEESADD